MPGAAFSHPVQTPWARRTAGHRDALANLVTGEASMIRASKRHLADVGENYLEHLRTALGFSLELAKASVACGAHAIVPGICTDTASRSVAELQAKLVMRAARGREPATPPTTATEAQQRSENDRARVDT